MSATLRTNSVEYDVAVIGGGPGGLSAAIAAGRAGARTIIVERTSALGGAAASGLGILGYLDRSGNKALGGIAQELIDRLVEVGGSPGHFPCPVHNSITPVSPDLVKIIAVQMCREAGVDILFNNELLDVAVEDGAVRAATVYGKLTKTIINADVFIDATGDGDLAYLAGVPHKLGQDGTQVMQPSTLMFTVTGHDLDRFFDFLDEHPEEMGIKEEYAGGYTVDFLRKTRGHCFIGLTAQVEKARAAGDFTVPRNQFIYISTASERFLAINTSRVTRINAADPLELSAGLETGYQQIMEIVEFMRGVPGFEEVEISQIAPALGIRETRHFCGEHRLTMDSLEDNATAELAVAQSAYNIDIHSGTGDGIDLSVIEKPFGIPYGCLVPQGVDGLLLSGRTISVDSTVFASARVMGTCLAIGEAAGTAAALALREQSSVRDVDVQQLRALLRDNGNVLPSTSVDQPSYA
ncbi:FAD-dependent oxidoreductase [Rhodococcus sp. IEGM 1366]|uniref:FAD-dependent oxidoreductase n=1 Tax=Rhodococcus sp. IEGM 1366 TaxID=3082223 RepID=UPI002955984A|nr:FAD-dependent oxidoreductase [Rhodococcus sp. IEGM 1366]MDV8071271.1 FAD-dependent oxidoreductase [Rhodococcus sp. IEGM 1366]